MRTAKALVLNDKYSEGEALLSEVLPFIEEKARDCDLLHLVGLHLSARIYQAKQDLAKAQEQAEKCCLLSSSV